MSYSVFQLLAERKSKGHRSFERGIEPVDRLGDMIEQEFNERAGILQSHETELARDYFEKDVGYSCNAVTVYLMQAEEKYLPCTEDEREYFLRKAGEFYNRAKKDIERAERICPGINPQPIGTHKFPSFEIFFQHLSDQIHIMWEFPLSWKELVPLNLAYRMALSEENYELADNLMQRINAVIEGRSLFLEN
jgi:hypothetical protein